jgi:phosphate butyryltransferase
MIRNMQELLAEARTGEPGKLAVAVAQDSYVLDAVVQATDLGMVAPILVGDEAEIRKILANHQKYPHIACGGIS